MRFSIYKFKNIQLQRLFPRIFAVKRATQRQIAGFSEKEALRALSRYLKAPTPRDLRVPPLDQRHLPPVLPQRPELPGQGGESAAAD